MAPATNYPWYEKNKPGEKRLLAALKQRKDSNYFLGMFSCDSKKHFKNDVYNVSKGNGIFTTRVAFMNEAERGILILLNSFLNFSCVKSVEKPEFKLPLTTDFP